MRLGIIRINGQFLRNGPEELAHIFKLGIVPLDMTSNCWEDNVEIKCYYEGFRDLSDHEAMPHYNITANFEEGKEIAITINEAGA